MSMSSVITHRRAIHNLVFEESQDFLAHQSQCAEIQFGLKSSYTEAQALIKKVWKLRALISIQFWYEIYTVVTYCTYQ